MRTITLELLRHGPAHNQLLSPLTPYLALCENHAAVTLHVPFEHNQFLHRWRALDYKGGEESRVFQLNDTAKVLGDFLGEIPGLLAESNKEDHEEAEPLTHLRLILSSSELAILPFELALSPNGLPGAGQHLLLQPQMPLCLTREIRRVSDEQLLWPKVPRILFVAASPPSVGPIPLESHLLAMRRVISPWVKYFDEGEPEMRRKRVEEHLHFLPEASIEAIEHACASAQYTHVHILAHGVEMKETYDTRFYLALHNSLDPSKAEYISGSRLATALRAAQRPDSRGLARPVVVTLASCDSGNVGSVVGAGASIAHALHESGVPLVVAGQFPLSFEASVRIIECLYEGLLWGTDPRPLLYDLRRRLYSQFQQTHDWASLTAYVSLPKDFERQLAGVQIEQVMRSINAAMNHADEATSRFFNIRSSSKRKAVNAEVFKNALQRIEDAKKKLERLLKCLPAERTRITGLLASTEKRHAEVLYTVSQTPFKKSAAEDGIKIERNPQRDHHASIERLRKSRDYYWDAFVLDKSESWAVVQYLSLTMVMARSQHFEDKLEAKQTVETEYERPEKNLNALWSLARLLSMYELNNENRHNVIWAHGNLIELYMLSLIMPSDKSRLPNNEAEKLALEHTDALIDAAGRDAFSIYSTRRQFNRYLRWYGKISQLGAQFTRLANAVFAKFPEEVEERWK